MTPETPYLGRRRWSMALVAAATVAAAASMSVAMSFQDPLDTPATPLGGVARGEMQPLIAVAASESRTLAVGLRGLIVYSDDGGAQWRQATVPVQTDLVSVQLQDDRQVWASGHDSVILHSEDGGTT